MRAQQLQLGKHRAYGTSNSATKVELTDRSTGVLITALRFDAASPLLVGNFRLLGRWTVESTCTICKCFKAYSLEISLARPANNASRNNQSVVWMETYASFVRLCVEVERQGHCGRLRDIVVSPS